MAKTKTPFFGLGSQGSVGESITTQKRGRDTLIRTSPVPTDPYTLPQAYQRWLYRDYAYLWTKQSAATRQLYATAGSRHHLTGFQYWMMVMLSTLPDIVGCWKYDLISAGTTPDSSPQNNPGIVTGASPTTGLINNALYFDGLNDRVVAPYIPSYDLSTFSLECFFTADPDVSDFRTIFNKQTAPENRNFWVAIYQTTGIIAFRLTVGAVSKLCDSVLAFNDGLEHYLVAQYDRSFMKIYVDLIEVASLAEAGIPDTPATPFNTGQQEGNTRFFFGTIDNPVIRNRTLDATERQRHSERRYPP